MYDESPGKFYTNHINVTSKLYGHRMPTPKAQIPEHNSHLQGLFVGNI